MPRLSFLESVTLLASRQLSNTSNDPWPGLCHVRPIIVHLTWRPEMPEREERAIGSAPASLVHVGTNPNLSKKEKRTAGRTKQAATDVIGGRVMHSTQCVSKMSCRCNCCVGSCTLRVARTDVSATGGF